MWIPFKSFRSESVQDPQARLSRFRQGTLFILLVFSLLFNDNLSAAGLQLTTGKITLITDRGDSSLLRSAERLIQEERSGYAEHYHLTLDKQLTIWFYYDPESAQGSLHAVPYWSAGIARAGSEIYIYGKNRSQWLSTLRHELLHTLLAQNEIVIPVWLNEGLAQWQAGQMDWGGFMEMGTATARGKLIPLVDLDVILSFNHKRASLAYGQALDATRFLIDRQGVSILPFLLQADERSFRERFRAETKEDLIDFEIAWREDLEQRFWFFKISQIPTVLWAFSPLIVVLAWYLRRRKNQRKLKDWEIEELLEDKPKFFA